MSSPASVEYVIGIDIGGTFTDAVVWGSDGVIGAGKSFTTNDDLVLGLIGALDDAVGGLGLERESVLRQTRLLLHGTTVGTNAVVERRGAKVAVVCTRGHRDVLSMMRAAGRVAGLPPERLLDVAYAEKPAPLVPPSLIFEIDERTLADGSVFIELDEEAAEAIAADVVEAGCDSIAVTFLWAQNNARNELRCRELLAGKLGQIPISLSHEVAPRVGEYERFVATIINAYVGPRLVDYLTHLQVSLERKGFGGTVLIMNCNGGVIGSAHAGAMAVQTINSGPAAGVLGCERLAAIRGEPNVVTTDMGGTTFDVAIVTGGRPVRRSTSIAHQHEYYVETLDVQSVGAGGGSVAWVDEVTGALHVGPRSAGSDPGPACYARGGTEATVTDADVVLGVINPENFLGGTQHLDVERAQAAVAPLGDLLGLSMLETAAGICQIADAKMADLIRRMTVKRGLDPRGFVVYAYGGAGPLHVGAYGRELGATTAVVPLGNLAPVWSAFGAAAANVTRARFAPLILLEPFDTERIRATIEQLAGDVTAALREEGFSTGAQRLEQIAEVRYGAQIHTLNVDIPELVDGWDHELIDRFERDYELTYGVGTGYRKAGVEISGVKVTGVGLRTLPPLPRHDLKPPSGSESVRDIYWYELRRSVTTPIRNHGELRPNETLSGPTVVELPTTSVVIRPGQSAQVDSSGNVVLSLDGSPAAFDLAADNMNAGVLAGG